MAKILCKMCGGTIEVAREEKSCECPYCGSLVTVPRLDSDVKERLYARAEHFRQTQNFEKALATYEEIAKQDASDPEIFWGIVLSRFGIEYVEDPRSRERIPTCHRVQFDSILQDADYLEALELAAGTPEREIYEREAKRIAEIQREILKISAQEKPYDVFISFKEKTDAGTRTRDAVDAQEIYGRLTRAGLRVFFAPISLEGKIGQHYEPFIFAALNSARVMVVIGSKVEYFNAPWVRNEWGRFLALLKKDRSRLLIPCFKDITAYDLPEELSMFQALDMAKLGFVQDLQHVIEKTVARSRERESGGNAKTGRSRTRVTFNGNTIFDDFGKIFDNDFFKNAGGNAEVEPVSFENKVKRIHRFLADGEWSRADDYCESCLDQDVENAEIYLLKTQAEFHCGNAENLFGYSLGNSKNFANAKRFAQGDLRERLVAIEEKSQKMREIREFMDRAFYRQNFELVTEDECREIFDKLESFSESECAAWSEIESAKKTIADLLWEDCNTYDDIVKNLAEQNWAKAIDLAGTISLKDFRDVAAKKQEAFEGAYSQGIGLCNQKQSVHALALFKKLPKKFRQTQLWLLRCYVNLNDWSECEKLFNSITDRSLMDAKCEILYDAMKSLRVANPEQAHKFCETLARLGYRDCGQILDNIERDAKIATWILGTIVVIVVLLVVVGIIVGLTLLGAWPYIFIGLTLLFVVLGFVLIFVHPAAGILMWVFAFLLFIVTSDICKHFS